MKILTADLSRTEASSSALIHLHRFLTQLVKNPLAMWETWVQFLGRESFYKADLPLNLALREVMQQHSMQELGKHLFFRANLSAGSNTPLLGNFSTKSEAREFKLTLFEVLACYSPQWTDNLLGITEIDMLPLPFYAEC